MPRLQSELLLEGNRRLVTAGARACGSLSGFWVAGRCARSSSARLMCMEVYSAYIFLIEWTYFKASRKRQKLVLWWVKIGER